MSGLAVRVASHPLAELIPAMTDIQYAELREDIREHGLREPITLYEGKILDGRHRARACEELGITPATRQYDGDEPAAFVISLNVKRRDLTAGQRAMVAVEALPALEAEARARQGARTDLVTDGHKTSGPDGPEVRARDQAAALVGVSGRSVQRAKRVQEEYPELADEVRAGTVSLTAADQILTQPVAQPRTAPKVFQINHGRDQQWAESARRKISNLIAGFEGARMGLADFPIERAIAASNPDEINEWVQSLGEILAELKRLRTRLQEESRR